jgi:hypothetical protein
MNDIEILELIEKWGLYKTITENKIDNEFFIRNISSIDIDLFFRFVESGDYIINEKFIKELIDNFSIEKERLFDLPMLIYIELSESFIKEYEEYLNWNRLFLYYITNDNIDVWDYEDVISKYDLWHLASTIKLPIQFIEKYSDKLDWEYVSILNDFEDYDLEKFPNLLYYETVRERKIVKNLI